MPDKAELNRRRVQPQRDKARNRRGEEEEEVKRRRAQSQRDKARKWREEDERITRITRAVQRQLALNCQLSQPAAISEAQSSTISLVAIMEARLAKFMRDIARYSPFRLAQLYLTFIGCVITRNIPMPRSLSTVKNYLFTNPLSARKANTSKRHSRTRSLRESSGVLTFDNDSGAAHWRVFEYLYTGDYSDDLSHDFEGTVEVKFVRPIL
jgi:hypothetical protein